jgi:hypothetical protein
MGYIEVGGLTPFHGGHTTKVAVAGGLITLCGGQTTRGSLSPLYFSRNKILSIFFGASVFSRIMRALSNSREGDYSLYFQGR